VTGRYVLNLWADEGREYAGPSQSGQQAGSASSNGGGGTSTQDTRK
jgi:hypothetical protein